MFHASKKSQAIPFPVVKYNGLRAQNELGPNYARYGRKRDTPFSFEEVKYNVLCAQIEPGRSF